MRLHCYENCFNMIHCPELKLQYLFVRSSSLKVFLGRAVVKTCSKLRGEHPPMCSSVNLLHIILNTFKSTSGGMLLIRVVLGSYETTTLYHSGFSDFQFWFFSFILKKILLHDNSHVTVLKILKEHRDRCLSSKNHGWWKTKQLSSCWRLLSHSIYTSKIVKRIIFFC